MLSIPYGICLITWSRLISDGRVISKTSMSKCGFGDSKDWGADLAQREVFVFKGNCILTRCCSLVQYIPYSLSPSRNLYPDTMPSSLRFLKLIVIALCLWRYPCLCSICAALVSNVTAVIDCCGFRPRYQYSNFNILLLALYCGLNPLWWWANRWLQQRYL